MTLDELADRLEAAIDAARTQHADTPAGRAGIPWEDMRDTSGRHLALDALTALADLRAAIARTSPHHHANDTD